MADIWSKLPDLQWAGLPPVPSALISFSWENSLATRQAPYIADAWHDDTGRGPTTFNARLFFDSGVQGNAFPELWNKWRPKLQEGKIDDLRHPLLGMIRARVRSVSGDLGEGKNRSGFAVDVSWTSSIDDPERIGELGDVSLTATAKEAEAGAKAFNVTWPDGGYAPSLEEAIAQLESFAFGLETTVSAYANKVAGTVSTMIDALDQITDPLSHDPLNKLLAVWDRAVQIAENATRTERQTSIAQIQNDITLDVFADSKGNTLAEVMQLNPSALRDPVVRAPATLVYYS